MQNPNPLTDRPQNPIAFVSGPLEPPQNYFSTHYEPHLRAALDGGHHFIVGPSRGIDTLTLVYLLRELGPADVRTRVVVYLSSSDKPPSKGPVAKFVEMGGKVVVRGKGHTERDEAMTKASHYDILRYRTEAECRAEYGAKYRPRVSGTERNERRRALGVGLVLQDVASSSIQLVNPRTLVNLQTTKVSPSRAFPLERSLEQPRSAAPPVPALSPVEKEVRNLQKKIREAEELLARKEAGRALEANQLGKIDRLGMLRLALCEAETKARLSSSLAIDRPI